jgi:hypothetical protein
LSGRFRASGVWDDQARLVGEDDELGAVAGVQQDEPEPVAE